MRSLRAWRELGFADRQALDDDGVGFADARQQLLLLAHEHDPRGEKARELRPGLGQPARKIRHVMRHEIGQRVVPLGRHLRVEDDRQHAQHAVIFGKDERHALAPGCGKGDR